MKDSRTQFSFSISAILLCTLVIGVGIYFMTGLSSNVRDLRQQKAVAELERDQLATKQKALDTAIATMSTKATVISQFKSAMPMDAQLPEAFAQTEAIIAKLSAADSGVSVKSYQISAPSDADGKIPVTISVDTNLDNLVNVTKIFQNNLRPFVINTMSIDAKTSPVYTTSLTMGITYNPTAPAVAPGTTTTNSAEDTNAK